MNKTVSITIALVLAVSLFGPASAGPFEDALRLLRAGDFTKAAAQFRALAEQGHAGAQYNLGHFYRLGRGVRKNPELEFQWKKKAADQGLVHAVYNIGAMYLAGRGVARDYGQALAWFLKAAAKDHPGAQVNIGYLYANGLGVPKDPAQALQWYRKAAAKNEDTAQYNLGEAHEKGLGVAADLKQAAAWYQLAAVNGHKAARQALARLAPVVGKIAQRGWRNTKAVSTVASVQRAEPQARFALQVLDYTQSGNKNANHWEVVDLKKCTFQIAMEGPTRKWKQILYLNNVHAPTIEIKVAPGKNAASPCPVVKLRGSDTVMIREFPNGEFDKASEHVLSASCRVTVDGLKKAWALLYKQTCKGAPKPG